MTLDDRLQKLALSSYPSHKAKQAILSDLLEIIDGNRVDREATRVHMEANGATDDQLLNMEIEADDTDDILNGVAEEVKKYCD